MESLEKLLSTCGNSRYKLVVVASKRALELAEGKPLLINTMSLANFKPSVVALEEISQGKVHLKA